MQTNASIQHISSPAFPAQRKTWLASAVHGCTILAAFAFVTAIVVGIL